MTMSRRFRLSLWLALFVACATIGFPDAAQAQASQTLQLSRPIPQEYFPLQGFVYYSATFTINYTSGALTLASDKFGKGSFWADDMLTLKVTHADGSVATFTRRNECAPPASYAPLNIAYFFKPGANRIDVTLEDTCGVQFGASPLWLIGPFTYAPDYDFLYTIDLPWRKGVKEPRLMTQDWQGHWATGFALDFQHPQGGDAIKDTGVLAPMSGIIRHGYNGPKGLGNFVSIDAGNGWQALLAHMKEPSPIADGTFVHRGDIVGLVGQSGTDNIHIHAEVRRNNSTVDPAQVKYIYRRPRDAFLWDGTSKKFFSTNGTANFAFGRPSWTTSTQDASYARYKGNDGRLDTRWSSLTSSTTEWWTTDLDTETFNRIVINWEAAYAARHFVGWSYDDIHYFGRAYEVNKPGPMTYNLGVHTAPYVGVVMYEHAPGLGNYSFWEFETYRDAAKAASPSNTAAGTEAQPVGDMVMMTRTP